MKTVSVRGGLGNQLFCVAFAWSIARLTGKPVGLNLGGFAGDRYGRQFALGDLVRRMEGLRILSKPGLEHRLAGAALRKLPLTGHVGETTPPLGVARLRALISRGSHFHGYWQDEAYFADPGAVRANVRAFLDDQAPATVAHDLVIHFRTYKDEVRPSRRGTPDSGFFRRALAEVEARQGPVGDIRLVSDDVSLALDRIGPLGRAVTPVMGGGAHADMMVLLRARNLILTNSSFSWWGGFCGDAETVIYPGRANFHHYPAPARRFVRV